ncbi:MAG TPA: M24 family metallopeptidase [Pyrinomonadaceae bacterium]
MTTETAEKVDRIVRMLTAENLGGVLLRSQHNFSWLTGGARNGIDLSRESGAGGLVVRQDGKCFVLANRIEMPRLLAEELPESDFEPVELPWEDEYASPEFLVDKARALLGQGGLLGSDLPLNANTRTVEAAVARCRYQLTEPELKRFRSLGLDAGQAISELVRTLDPGQTEREVAAQVVSALAARGAYAVVTLIAADERIKSFRHPVPTDLKWKKVLLVVACARRGGLIASLTRIVCSGSLPDELRRRTIAAARVNAQLLAATRPGATGAELYKLAAQTYASEGFEGEERLHHQGGACGYRTRDWVAQPLSAQQVCLNQAFAWNPSVTGTKVEETCVAFADGVELITATPDWPQISVKVNGRAYQSPDVLSI